MNTRSGIRRIGLLTGGGDCPGLNAVIRAVVKTALRRHHLEVTGFYDGYSGLILDKARILQMEDVSGIICRGGTILGTSNRDNPFCFPVWVKGKKILKDVSDRAIRNLKRRKIEALIVIGGDGSLSIARELWQKGVAVVGVPKTIDNDLSATDVTFGFDTALQTAMEGIDKIHSTAESHHRVMVVEVMGRYAGWIALESGVAGGADVILIPEIPYDVEKICEKIRERYRHGKHFSIIVIAEGARQVKGELTVQKMVEDSTDPVRLGGVGHKVGNEVEKKTSLETRVTILGHVQRGGSPTAFDRVLGTRFGTAAVELVMQGKFGRMVCLRGTNIRDVSLERSVKKLRRVSPDCDLISSARALGICMGD